MTDRLAAARAQRQQQQNGALQSTGQAHEMTNLRSNDSFANGNGVNATSAFLDETASIQSDIEKFNANVVKISELHTRSLDAVEDTSRREEAQLDALAAETRTLGNDIKTRIKALEGRVGSGTDAETRRNRTQLVRSNFMDALRNYRIIEQNNQQKTRERVARQFKIVKPDATPDEITAVVNDEHGGGHQIFAQALSSSTRYADGRAAYREVQDRHQEIRRMEQTLAELTQLFNDMGELVESQDPTINNVEHTATAVEKDTEAALQETGKAVWYAAAARKKRWICFFIFLIVLAVIAIALAVTLSHK